MYRNQPNLQWDNQNLRASLLKYVESTKIYPNLLSRYRNLWNVPESTEFTRIHCNLLPGNCKLGENVLKYDQSRGI